VIAGVKYLLIAAARDSRVVHGLGWVEIFQVLVGWVGSTIAKAIKKFERIMLMHLKQC